MRLLVCSLILTLAASSPATAEVTGVTITARAPLASGEVFGETGPYERLTGRILFAIDPDDPRNTGIVDLALAPRGTDGRVYFSADLLVLQPADRTRGNGVMLFDVANRGRALAHTFFNGARAGNPSASGDVGDGFLMREGYTLVWIGWQFDVAAPLLSLEAPRADLDGKPDTVRLTFVVNEASQEAQPADLPAYAPVDRREAEATLTVRDRFWEPATLIARERWQFVPSAAGRPRIRLEGGFDPGRVYELSYRSLDASVAGAGFAALRDAASAFRYRDDLPVQGQAAYAFGISQSGRFLRQFLREGFNADEQGRPVFDAVWAHVAGAGLGSFNERFAMPGYSSFSSTRFPFTDAAQTGADGTSAGILATYAPEQQPKVIYTNSSVEYWGQGRAAALTHTTIDGTADVALPDNVRLYLLAGSQHVPSAFPPQAGRGQQLPNPVPHAPVMRALLRALHRWARQGTPPPESRYPRLGDGTLVPVDRIRFPGIPGVADPRTIEGPGQRAGETVTPLPFLVPQVDDDGNEMAGIRMPDVSVPLATMTGWNFRSPSVGRPGDIYPLLGSYIPFAKTRAAREQDDPRASIAERYADRDQYLTRVESAIAALVKDGFLLDVDVPAVRERAAAHWEYATGEARRPE